MSKYNYILLDWDGNLARTLDIWLKAVHQIFAARGISVTDEEVASCFGAPRERYEELGITDTSAAFKEMDAAASKFLLEVELYPHAREMLEALKKQGKHLALITTSPKANVEGLVEKHGLRAFFDAIITHEDTENHKPHPDPLLKALERMNGDPKSAVMIGDSEKDILAAKNAGMDSILFFPSDHAKFYDIEKFKALQPTYVVGDFQEVLKLL